MLEYINGLNEQMLFINIIFNKYVILKDFFTHIKYTSSFLSVMKTTRLTQTLLFSENFTEILC